MPWTTKRNGAQWCVHKEGSSTPIPGGCHKTKREAEAQRRALYASEAASASGASIAPMGSATDLASAETTRVTVTVKGDPNAVESGATDNETEQLRKRWYGVLGLQAHPTDDGRIVAREDVGIRDLPSPLFVQTKTAEGHDGSEVCGRIEAIEFVPLAEFDKTEEFGLEECTKDSIVIYGEGTLDTSEHAASAERMIENGADISIDGLHFTSRLLDGETLEEIDTSDLEMSDILEGIFTRRYLRELRGDIAGATIVGVGGFREARIGLVASAGLRLVPTILVAAAAPFKPPREWFEDPQLTQLTPLTITKEGRVFGHLADWSGCHTGFSRICVPPFRSPSNYAYFNTGEIETAEGDLIPCGKLMFSREGGKHASIAPQMTVRDVEKHYDDATKVAGFVRAGADRFGTWLSGSLRPSLTEEDIQHLRTHPPSGDWRPIPGRGTELIAAFSVAVPGFPIPRALVASAADGLTFISGPLTVPPLSRLEIVERRRSLRERAAAALGG